ncbi:MAG TPA: flagellar biosynthetic protein FliO [Candidatus Aquilonibacter sp.]|nr:flagellar biosynthetic protein FliO [Candidatus Aquilonibacter sp.]
MQTARIADQFAIWTEALGEIVKRVFRRDRLFRAERQLRLCETLSLGQRGFLAVVRYEDQRFLLGGTNQSLALLAELSRAEAADARSGRGSGHE